MLSILMRLKLCLLVKDESNVTINSILDNKILDLSKIKAFVDDKLNMTKKLKFFFDRVSLTLSSIYTHFNTLKKKALGKHCGKRLSTNTFNLEQSKNLLFGKELVNLRLQIVICSFFEFCTVSKWCIREWVKKHCRGKEKMLVTSIFSFFHNVFKAFFPRLVIEIQIWIGLSSYTFFLPLQCNQLADVGEESFLVSVRVNDGTCEHVGSIKGDHYCLLRQEMMGDFHNFCLGKYSLTMIKPKCWDQINHLHNNYMYG